MMMKVEDLNENSGEEDEDEQEQYKILQSSI